MARVSPECRRVRESEITSEGIFLRWYILYAYTLFTSVFLRLMDQAVKDFSVIKILKYM
jgi:hypothetical protein